MEQTGRLDKLRITVLAEDSVPYETPYLAQHGVSFLVEGIRGDVIRRVLFDVGQNSQALLYNMRLLNIVPSTIDAIVLSHCHYDHTQGVVDVLKEMGKSDVPVIAHQDLFRLHFLVRPFLRHVGVMQGDSREKIESSGGTLFLTSDPLMIMPGLLTTGEVKRQTDFEEVGIDLKTIEDGQIKDDPVLDDISLVADVEDKGIVVVTCCGHAGIINITRQAMELTGTSKVEAIIGGLHLIDATEPNLKRAVQELTQLNPGWICAGHCTGFKAQVELYLAFKERFSPLHAGLTFEV